MARAKSSTLAVKAKRLALPIDKNPVFEVLGVGISVGYRRCEGAGTWVARRSDGKRGKLVKRLGIADDYGEADGINVLSWSQAQEKAFAFDPAAEKAARKEAEAKAEAGRAAEAESKLATVADALDEYDTDLKTRGGDLGNVDRLRKHIVGDLLGKAVANLTTSDLKVWRDALVGKLAPASVNRTCNAFKAALNLAADSDDRVLTRNAWEKGLSSLPDAKSARNVILNDKRIREIVKASYELEGDPTGHFVEVTAETGARPSQTANLLIADLQDDRPDPRLMMPSSKKGKGKKKIVRRPVAISVQLAGKLREVSKGRPATASLLLKAPRPQSNEEKEAGTVSPREPWSKSDHYRAFQRIAMAVFGAGPKDERGRKTPPLDVSGSPITIYALRHSSIVRQILAGVPVRVVAVNHDTSVAMIEKNYSAYLSDHADGLTRAALRSYSEAAE